MALCLPRNRSATSLATRPSTLSVASSTNHSCFTSAGLALKVFMSVVLLSARRFAPGIQAGGSVPTSGALLVFAASHRRHGTAALPAGKAAQYSPPRHKDLPPLGTRGT